MANRAEANPSGGVVTAGTATISNAGTTTTINQATATAIINWQQFSIAGNEATQFVVPNASSSTLNRVLGGNPSAIYGTLSSNGNIILINPSGIVVGPGGRIDTAGFIGSTLNVSDAEFGKDGNLHFVGDVSGSVDNEGTIHASSGDVYLIAGQVTNGGAISAPRGTAGLAAGTDVLYQQSGDQHLYVRATPLKTARAVGVTNRGTIRAATAELAAAGGNAYALAINNTGQIAATGFRKVNGQVFLTADTGTISNGGTIRATTRGQGGTIKLASKSGTIVNSGKLDVSATAPQGRGGSISLQSEKGTVANTAGGQIDARGGQGGVGGQVEMSGGTVQPFGLVDTIAPGGRTGMFTIDPATFTVAATGGNETGAQVGMDLATTNVTLSAGTTLVIDDAITWTSTSTLTLNTTTPGSTIVINAPIAGANGGLTLDTAGATDAITTGAAGSVDVSSFILQNGFWTQNSASLPGFAATYDFELQGSSTFLRVTGGNGGTSSPYEITDIYGLQGLGSPSASFTSADAELVNDITATGTSTWNGGEGFVPIGNGGAFYSGTFDGQGHVINGLFIDRTNRGDVGLFGVASGALENIGLTNVQITGGSNTGGLVGSLGNDYSGTSGNGTITKSYSTGTVSGGNYVGGLAGLNHGTLIEESFSAGTVTGGSFVGGLVGSGLSPINDSYSTADVTAAGGPVGGLEGENYFGGVVHNNYSSGMVTGAGEVGALVGRNLASIDNSFWDEDSSGITSPSGGVGSGTNSGVTPATTAELHSEAYILANAPVSPTWAFNTVWTTNDGRTRPQLIGVSPTLGSGGNTGGSGGVTGGTGGNNPIPGLPVVGGPGGVDHSGSNALPPQLTPPNQDTIPTLTAEAATIPTVPQTEEQPFGFAGSGDFSQTGAALDGLAFASGSGGPIAAGDAAQLNSGQMNNVSNPAAAGALEASLSPAVHDTLQEALVAVSGVYDSYDDSAEGTTDPTGGATELGNGDVVEIDDGNVKKIPLSSAPQPLRDALSGTALRGLQPAGH